MKKNKFLFLIPSIALTTSIPCIGSCAKPPLSIKDIKNAIFHPVEEEERVEGTFVSNLKTLNKKNLQKELIYRLFAANETWAQEIQDWEDDITIVSNIKTCNIYFDGNEVYASFRGYIDFVFKDEVGDFHKNDIRQVTFLFEDLGVTPIDDDWSLHPTLPEGEKKYAFGFVEDIKDGHPELLVSIDKLERPTIPNWHHWAAK